MASGWGLDQIMPLSPTQLFAARRMVDRALNIRLGVMLDLNVLAYHGDGKAIDNEFKRLTQNG